MADDPRARVLAAELEDFTRVRGEVARELRAAGQRDEAAEVAALRKPTVPVWVANRLARDEPAAVKRLLDAAAKLRSAHGGKGDLRAAAAAENDALRTLVAKGRALRPLSDAFERRLSETLRSAAANDGTRELLERGLLDEELGPTGFEALAGLSLPSPSPRRSRPAGPPKPKRDEAAAQARAEARERLAAAKRDRADAARRLKAAESEVAAAERAVAQAERRASL